MSTQVRDPVVTGERKVTGGRNWIVVLVVGLLAAVVGLGVGYVAFSPSSDSEGAADVQTLLDDYFAAFNAGDADATLALFAENAHYFSYELGEAPESVVRDFIESNAASVEGPDNLVVTGDSPQYRASSTGCGTRMSTCTSTSSTRWTGSCSSPTSTGWTTSARPGDAACCRAPALWVGGGG